MKKTASLLLVVCATALSSFAQSGKKASLTWTPSISAYTANNVERWDGACPASGVPSGTPVKFVVAAPTAGYDDASIVEGKTYCYTVRAFNSVSGLESADSNTAQAVYSFQAPQAPTNLKVVVQ